MKKIYVVFLTMIFIVFNFGCENNNVLSKLSNNTYGMIELNILKWKQGETYTSISFLITQYDLNTQEKSIEVTCPCFINDSNINSTSVTKIDSGTIKMNLMPETNYRIYIKDFPNQGQYIFYFPQKSPTKENKKKL